MICKLADFLVEFKNPSRQVEEFFKDYIHDGVPQVSFEINEQDIDFENTLMNGKYGRFNNELSAMLRKFTIWSLDENAIFLHSALIDVDGVGVAFAAPSGTGKTTHMRLWQQLLGDKVIVVNGDKPTVRFFEDIKFPVGYGTPWNGKEMLGINGKTNIKHFCFIERSEINSCEQMNPSDSLQLFFQQIFISRDNIPMMIKTLKLADKFLKNVAVWKIKCNMDISAAKVAYDTIFKENTNEA